MSLTKAKLFSLKDKLAAQEEAQLAVSMEPDNKEKPRKVGSKKKKGKKYEKNKK